MKKTLISLSAAFLIFTAMQPVLYADTTGSIDDDDPNQNVYVFSESLDTVDTLNLNEVLDRALKNSHNLAMLTLKYAAQGSKKRGSPGAA
ncbi:hypothetical protein [Paenibacillus hexagrammi]|uniref:Uncharacterized protein n=1 Tax=Paenibacillus hexagrammi TaxID=2908839 RepID=A0ABY3SGZ8_9BACL|nr:hypothetical protein [Paenibacillus sp. YPD9-1]UJF32454.1 hypothetical protein L0M14_22685 [Paenibacillus sp. YPD9-1]